MRHSSVYKSAARLGLLTMMLAALTTVPALAAGWNSEKPIEVKAKLPAGKGLKTYTSPDKKRWLIIRDEENHGDFFYYSYYYFDGKQYTLLQTYVATGELPSVTWARDHVSFQAKSPTGPGEVQVMQVEYYPAKSQLRYKVLRTEAMEMTG